MFGNLFRELETRFPWLSTWLGGRLEVELPAFLVSLTMHGLLLVALAFAGYRVHQEASQRVSKRVSVDNLMPSDSTYQDLDQSDQSAGADCRGRVFAPNLAPTITSAPSSAGVVPTALPAKHPQAVQLPSWSSLMSGGRPS